VGAALHVFDWLCLWVAFVGSLFTSRQAIRWFIMGGEIALSRLVLGILLPIICAWIPPTTYAHPPVEMFVAYFVAVILLYIYLAGCAVFFGLRWLIGARRYPRTLKSAHRDHPTKGEEV